MTAPITKTALIDRARRERAGWEGLLAEVGEANLDAPGAMGPWTFRDLLPHLEAWQRFEQAPLERALRGDPPAPPWPPEPVPPRGQDRINRIVHEATHDRPPAETVREARRTWDRPEDGLAALPEAALADPDRFPWMGGKALGPTIVRDATAHVHQGHEADVRAWLVGRRAAGQASRATPGSRSS